jgi:hypothetical protein
MQRNKKFMLWSVQSSPHLPGFSNGVAASDFVVAMLLIFISSCSKRKWQKHKLRTGFQGSWSTQIKTQRLFSILAS